MTQGKSSSNRAAGVCDAVLVREQRPLGPMRLPDNRVDDFIDHFNRTYRSLGLSLDPLPAEDDKKIPGSLEATGDDVSG